MRLTALGLGILLPCASLGARAEEKRDREWLLRYVTQPIPDTPRNRAYLKKIDAASLRGILDSAWLERGIGSGKGRLQATLIGQMAFAYHAPRTRWHKDRKLLEEIRLGFRGFAKHQNEEGRFVWPQQDTYEHQGHEHVWRLEPLLYAHVWVKDDLPADERDAWLAMLRKGGEYLLTEKGVVNQPNNRGTVWCAGAQLCGLYFEDPRYLEALKSRAPAILAGVMDKQGQVRESQGGGGPDGNYSAVGFSYAYLYRVLSGQSEIDERMLACARWLSLYATTFGDLLAAGASTRKADERSGLVLPALERYSAREPFFAALADRALERGEDTFGRGGCMVHPYVWALLEPRGGEPAIVLPPWFRNHAEIYEESRVHYLLVARPGYQTGVTFRGVLPLRGLQAFAAWDEPAIVQHSGRDLRGCSTTRAAGIDTEKIDVSKGPHGWEVWLKEEPPPVAWNGIAPVTVVTRHGKLWTCYAFTPRTALVVHGGVPGPLESIWSMNRVRDPVLDPKARVVSTPGRKARIHYSRGEGTLTVSGGVPVLSVVAPEAPSAFAFTDDSFRFGAADPGMDEIRFSDGAGAYRLSIKDVLDSDGNIDRPSSPRLCVAEAK